MFLKADRADAADLGGSKRILVAIARTSCIADIFRELQMFRVQVCFFRVFLLFRVFCGSFAVGSWPQSTRRKKEIKESLHS